MMPTGEGGVEGDGDITRPENITAFQNFVLDNTDRKGVHFLMADGVGSSCFCFLHAEVKDFYVTLPLRLTILLRVCCDTSLTINGVVD